MARILERFAAAVEILAGDGPVKTRLTAAYSDHLDDLKQVDLPIAGRQRFTELHAALHSATAIGKTDAITASVRKMSPQQAADYARTIVRLYAELVAMEQGDTRFRTDRAPRPVAEAPPRFLIGNR